MVYGGGAFYICSMGNSCVYMWFFVKTIYTYLLNDFLSVIHSDFQLKTTSHLPGNSLGLGISKNPYFDLSLASVASFELILGGGDILRLPPTLMPIFISLLWKS